VSAPEQKLTIGILALQGAYDAHARRLTELGAEPRLIRKPDQLQDLDGLIIPGGESSTFLWHLERSGFYDVLQDFVRSKPTFGTCAGTILLASEVINPAQKSFAALDVTVERNAYGRQNDSAILEEQTTLPGGPLETVYIRAPRITRIGEGVETLASREASGASGTIPGSPTLVRQGNILASTFHPELSADTRVHQLFLDMVRQALVREEMVRVHKMREAKSPAAST
jgi:5'-phosphate synthase pdxT subunit